VLLSLATLRGPLPSCARIGGLSVGRHKETRSLSNPVAKRPLFHFERTLSPSQAGGQRKRTDPPWPLPFELACVGFERSASRGRVFPPLETSKSSTAFNFMPSKLLEVNCRSCWMKVGKLTTTSQQPCGILDRQGTAMLEITECINSG
jgi:hypothetical protein